MNASQNVKDALNNSTKRDAIWRAIVDALGGFSLIQRKVFVLYHYTGSSIPAIALRTGLQEDKVLEIIDQTNRLLMHRLQGCRLENNESLEGSFPGARLAVC